jgi:transposase
MRALDPEVFDAVWAAAKPLLPVHEDRHPLGCHRRRASDRECFRVMVARLVTGCSWEDAERLCGSVVSDTTARERRDEWVGAGVFDQMVTDALHAYDRVIGLDLSEVAVDGSQHKAPCGGEGTGRNGTDRGKLGWKWSILTDRRGIPIGWTTNGANRHDLVLFDDTLESADARGLLVDIETLHLDRGYDSRAVRESCVAHGLLDVVCAKKRPSGGDPRLQKKSPKTSVPLGLRWPVERTNSWLSNFGQLRRSTDRKIAHRLAEFALAVTFLIAAKLVDWRDRWTPDLSPIR